MAAETIQIVIGSTGAPTVIRHINNIGGAAVSAAGPIERLTSLLKGIGAALGVRQVMEWADTWAMASGKVSVFAKSQDQANAIMERLYQTAQNARQPLESLSNLYARLSITATDLGASQEKMLQFTELVSKVLAVQGTGAAQARGMLLQLSQAMGEGIVRAQEYNSMVENAPYLLKVVASNMDGIGGSLKKLRALMLSGKLYSKDFFEALLKGQDEVNAKYENTPRLFSQGFTVLINGLERYIGKLNQSLGVSNAFFNTMSYIAANMETIGKVVAVAGVAFITYFGPAILGAIGTGLVAIVGLLSSMAAILLANPFTVLLGAAAAAYAFGDAINIGLDDITTLRDLMVAIGQVGGQMFGEIAAIAGDVWGGIVSIVQGVLDWITGSTADATQTWAKDYDDFYADVGTGFVGMLRGIAKTFDAIGGLVLGVVIVISRALGGIPEAFRQVFNMSYNIVATVMEATVNMVISGVNKLRSFMGKDAIELVKFEKKDIDTQYFQKWGADVAKSIDDGFEMQSGYLQGKLETLLNKAQDVTRIRLSRRTVQPNLGEPPEGVDTGSPPGAKGAKGADKTIKEREKLQNSLRTLLDRIYPMSGALLEVAKAQDTLTRAEQAGLITKEEHSQYLEALTMHYRDVLDPMGKVDREIAEQTRLLGMGNRERQVEQQVLEVVHERQRAGQVLTKAEITSLRQKFTALQAVTEATRAQDDILASSVEKRRQLVVTLQAIRDLEQKPASGFTSADSQQARIDALSTAGVSLEGTQVGRDAHIAMLQQMYEQIDQMRQNDLANESIYQAALAQIQVKQTELRMQSYSDFFGNLASLSQSGNSKLALIGKAAAITQATIDGVLAVQKALASAPPPLNYALAASVGVATAVNVAKIASTPIGFKAGGYTGDLGVNEIAGAVHGREFVMNAPATKRIGVANLQALQIGAADVQRNGEQAGGVNVGSQTNLRIINVLDPALIGDYLSTPEGEQVLVNMLRRNSDQVRAIVNNA